MAPFCRVSRPATQWRLALSSASGLPSCCSEKTGGNQATPNSCPFTIRKRAQISVPGRCGNPGNEDRHAGTDKRSKDTLRTEDHHELPVFLCNLHLCHGCLAYRKSG